MILDDNEVRYIAHLARLQIDEAAIPQYQAELSGILALATRLDEVDTASVSPMAHPFNLTQRLREDVVTETDERQQFQKIAPAIERDLYLVPKIIDR